MKRHNEILDGSGATRPPYASFESRTGFAVNQPSASLIEELGRRGVVGGEGIYPVPLVLDEAEFRDLLVPGVLQRAYALQELFADIALGTGTIIESGLLDRDQFGEILASESADHADIRSLWRGRALDHVTFVYGPDIVRDSTSRWSVLEDNIGCVGGVADGPVVLERYLDVTGLTLHPDLRQCSQLSAVLEAYLRRLGLGAGDEGLYGIPGTWSQCIGCEFQTAWKGDVLRALGIALRQPDSLLDEIVAGNARPTAIINLSSTQALAYQRLASEVFTDSELPTFGAPCVGVVASKCFHALGDELVSLYLGEKALLKTPFTRILRSCPADLPDDGVLKRSSGCGGAEVFFLDESRERAARQAILDEVRRWGPSGAVLQELVIPSELEPRGSLVRIAASVEIRLIVYVCGWKAAFVDQIVTGRAIRRGGNRLGNISRGAQNLPVIREIVSDPSSG
jgi:hypothetical protein